MPETICVEGLTNQEFFEKHAAPGRVGLIGGSDLINRLIGRAQRRLSEDGASSPWAHAFLFQGRRQDGHHWLIESDLVIRTKHIRLGVQENRVAKYCDDTATPSAAVLDFGLTATQEQRVLAEALELVSAGTRYSLREIAGTAWAMRNPQWRPRENRLAREQAFYCSAMVRHVFGLAGIDLVGGVAVKNTAPEHLFRSEVPHTKWVLMRKDGAVGRLKRLVRRVRKSRADRKQLE